MNTFEEDEYIVDEFLENVFFIEDDIPIYPEPLTWPSSSPFVRTGGFTRTQNGSDVWDIENFETLKAFLAFVDKGQFPPLDEDWLNEAEVAIQQLNVEGSPNCYQFQELLQTSSPVCSICGAEYAAQFVGEVGALYKARDEVMEELITMIVMGYVKPMSRRKAADLIEFSDTGCSLNRSFPHKPRKWIKD